VATALPSTLIQQKCMGGMDGTSTTELGTDALVVSQQTHIGQPLHPTPTLKSRMPQTINTLPIVEPFIASSRP
jgi:hypothetical protein